MSEQLSPFGIHSTERSFQRSLFPGEVHVPFRSTRGRFEKIAKVAMSSAIVAGALSSLVSDNVVENQQQAANAVSSIDSMFPALAPDKNNTAIVFLDGFGSYNSKILADSLGAAVQQVQDGEIWSVNYGNALIDTEAIADRIEQAAEDKHIDTIQLFGYSAGGDIAIELATAVQERGLAVSIVYLASTPNGLEGLRENRQSEVDAYASVMGKIPWLAYYDPARYVGEMALKTNEIVSSPKPISAARRAHKETIDLLDYEYTPGTWLLIDQMVAIEQADVQQQLQVLSQNALNEKPVVVYLGTDAPGYDTFVDDKKSGIEICAYAAKADLPCFRYNVPGAIHMRPNLTVKEYAATLLHAAPVINPATDQ